MQCKQLKTHVTLSPHNCTTKCYHTTVPQNILPLSQVMQTCNQSETYSDLLQIKPTTMHGPFAMTVLTHILAYVLLI